MRIRLTCPLFPAFTRSVPWFVSRVEAIWIFPGVARCDSRCKFTRELWTLFLEPLVFGSYLFIHFCT